MAPRQWTRRAGEPEGGGSSAGAGSGGGKLLCQNPWNHKPTPIKMEIDSVKLFFLSHQLRPTLVCLKVKSETNILLDKYLLRLEPQIWDMLTEHWLFGCGSKIPSATTVLYNVWDIPHQTSQNHLLAWPCSQVVSPQCQPKFKIQVQVGR